MSRDRLRTSDESDPEEEEFDEEDEQVDADAGDLKEAEAEAEAESVEEDEADEEEEESSEKITSPARGLDYGSDADSGEAVTTPAVSDFVIERYSAGEVKTKKKRSPESQPAKENSEVKKSKKEKISNDVAAEEEVVVAKRSFGGLRIWGPEDELMILKGMLEYKEKIGVDFNSNLDAFYNYIKGLLNAVVDKSQLKNKIRKLKDKYRDNALKEANGESPVFSKGHEAEAYEHSKKIWGGKAVARSKSKGKKDNNIATDAAVVEVDNVLALPVPDVEMSKKEVNGGSANVANRMHKQKPKEVQKMEFVEADVEMKDVVPDVEMSKKEVNGSSAKAANRVRKQKAKEVQKMEFVEADVEMKDFVPMPAMVNDFVFRRGLELVDKSKVDTLNEKWTKYQIEAAELHVRRLDLIMEHTKLILDALKSNP